MKKVMAPYLVMIGILVASGSILDAQYVDLLRGRLAHFPFTEDARDISGFENHGEVNGATLTQGYGGVGGAYYFDGTNDYIYCGTKLAPLPSAVTVSCWIRTDSATDNSHVVSKYDFSSDGGFILGIQDGYVRWAGRIGSGQFIRITSSVRIADHQWHCLAGVVNGGTWSLYVDGVLENHVETETQAPELTTTTPLTIGCYSRGDEGETEFFRGCIDNVLIYGRALNDCELETLFTGTTYGPR
jgi:hypothetical protein